jgi:hypothetical protein
VIEVGGAGKVATSAKISNIGGWDVLDNNQVCASWSGLTKGQLCDDIYHKHCVNGCLCMVVPITECTSFRRFGDECRQKGTLKALNLNHAFDIWLRDGHNSKYPFDVSVNQQIIRPQLPHNRSCLLTTLHTSMSHTIKSYFICCIIEFHLQHIGRRGDTISFAQGQTNTGNHFGYFLSLSVV